MPCRCQIPQADRLLNVLSCRMTKLYKGTQSARCWEYRQRHGVVTVFPLRPGPNLEHKHWSGWKSWPEALKIIKSSSKKSSSGSAQVCHERTALFHSVIRAIWRYPNPKSVKPSSYLFVVYTHHTTLQRLHMQQCQPPHVPHMPLNQTCRSHMAFQHILPTLTMHCGAGDPFQYGLSLPFHSSFNM